MCRKYKNGYRLLELARSRKERFIIEKDGIPIAMLVAADEYDVAVRGQEKSKHPYIGRVEKVCGGEPLILGTRISVASVVEFFEESDSIDEILEALPLTPAQVHDALSYYYDNREEIDQILEQRRLENVVKKHNLVLKEVTEGVYEAHDADGRW
ncbi:MAG: DUF433 domain-containing protein [Anaerolineae bacterium]